MGIAEMWKDAFYSGFKGVFKNSRIPIYAYIGNAKKPLDFRSQGAFVLCHQGKGCIEPIGDFFLFARRGVHVFEPRAEQECVLMSFMIHDILFSSCVPASAFAGPLHRRPRPHRPSTQHPHS